MTTPTSTIIRGGRVLDIAHRRADPADVLVERGTIREIGPPGLAAPAAAQTFDARDRLLLPGLVNAHTHGHGGLSRGLDPRSRAAGAAAHGVRRRERQPQRGGQVSDGAALGHRAGAQGLHRLLRPQRRVPAAVGGRYPGRGPRLPRRGDSRGHRADDGRPHAVGSVARSGGGPPRSGPPAGGEDPHGALAGQRGGLPGNPENVAVRSRSPAPRPRAHDPHALQ